MCRLPLPQPLPLPLMRVVGDESDVAVVFPLHLFPVRAFLLVSAQGDGIIERRVIEKGH